MRILRDGEAALLALKDLLVYILNTKCASWNEMGRNVDILKCVLCVLITFQSRRFSYASTKHYTCNFLVSPAS